MKTLMILACGLLGTEALAADSGYIRDGKAVVVIQDGKKVGDWPAKREARAPSSVVKGNPRVDIYFDDDGTTRCYSIFSGGGANSADGVALSCVKK